MRSSPVIRGATVSTGPSGIGLDRAEVARLEGDDAVLRVGPGRTEVRVDTASLPDGTDEGTWLVMDLQSMPPLPLTIDRELTEARRDA
jgi:hypothetical protein